ncbi:tRNA (5-methylaminomethyl-2-thiouridine)(34)-methyltransferase MnmD [Sinisalibacter lacisalsi]|uniref:FAD-dependent oxidoreductase n=1 Tax=Sinisalibacter lacisalsi TaxID=1526570 RepID=A0ABQ1QMK2_9RHOB|nr:tRNA (5-methylaminomethyl-2-thiouridine)(34)-methyltransferase MnmD [Sinisalibacter lacisalsi]GGD36717.1 FAD-dependent oxidoreductase [Sinisalibacter lacisalsi]
MAEDQRSAVAWNERGTPVSTRFDDPYFSLEDGLAETRQTFLAGNDLPARFRPGFQVAELGFGTGLNMLATLIAFHAAGAPGPVRFTSFEAYPMAAADMARALAAFPEAEAVAGEFLGVWSRGDRRADLGGFRVEVIEGDARETLPLWQGRADAWFLDGFSPAKNPELWGDRLLADVARHTAPGGTAATYTAAGFVRRGLEAAGFTVERRPGFGRKRHMTVARLEGRR